MGLARNPAISKPALSVFEVCSDRATHFHKSEGPLSKYEIASVTGGLHHAFPNGSISPPFFVFSEDSGMRTATLPALLGLVCALAAVPLNASAQTWPDNPVVLVVPYSAGGPTDVVARLL